MVLVLSCCKGTKPLFNFRICYFATLLLLISFRAFQAFFGKGYCLYVKYDPIPLSKMCMDRPVEIHLLF